MTMLEAMMNRDAASGPASDAPGPAYWCDEDAGGCEETFDLDACQAFERIVVKTERSVYELVVLSGSDGDVMVRGGRFFPQFKRARIVGSTGRGSAVRLKTLTVGLRLELIAGRERFVTSRIEGIYRSADYPTGADALPPDVAAGRSC
jgi:hypothetical protein